MYVGRRHNRSLVCSRSLRACSIFAASLFYGLMSLTSVFGQISAWQQNAVREPAATTVRWKARDAEPPLQFLEGSHTYRR